jgi:hypothetical protein
LSYNSSWIGGCAYPEKANAMKYVHQHPQFNEHPYFERPVLAFYGKTPLGELIWLALPIIAFALVLILR